MDTPKNISNQLYYLVADPQRLSEAERQSLHAAIASNENIREQYEDLIFLQMQDLLDTVSPEASEQAMRKVLAATSGDKTPSKTSDTPQKNLPKWLWALIGVSLLALVGIAAIWLFSPAAKPEPTTQHYAAIAAKDVPMLSHLGTASSSQICAIAQPNTPLLSREGDFKRVRIAEAQLVENSIIDGVKVYTIEQAGCKIKLIPKTDCAACLQDSMTVGKALPIMPIVYALKIEDTGEVALIWFDTERK